MILAEKLANRVVEWIIRYNPDSRDKYDIFIYAIECMCGFVFSNGLILSISFLLRMPLQAIIGLVFHNSLRFYIGGSHAESFGVCLAGGIFFSSVCIVMAKYLEVKFFFLQIEIVFCIIITYFIAPVIHPNRLL